MMTVASGGLWMLVLLAAAIVGTGLPVWALLIGVACVSAAAGVMLGAFDVAVLGAMPVRLTGLLENDLLQALPLYVLVGVLLKRVALADAIFDTLTWLARRTGAGRAIGALGLGLLVAPMNGSVASSSSLLARLVASEGREQPGESTAESAAVVAAASTVGVVVPPSLVLILLGDSMMRAHTEAANLAPAAASGPHLVNTQDVLHAALLPAGGLMLAWLAVAIFQSRRDHSEDEIPAPSGSRRWKAAAAVAAILALLAAVFTGRVFAVEAAAAGGVGLAMLAVATRAVDRAGWAQVLADTMALSGALFALLVGATTFSLVFRLWGTDQWLAALVLQPAWPDRTVAALVLAGVAACACVLDAFEMIFVIVPIVSPALIVRLADAQQVAVLLLLVLQMSFLLPPMGYAVMLVRAQPRWATISTMTMLRALWPYVAAQLLCMVLVFTWPAAVHRLDEPLPQVAPAAMPSDEDITERMREMANDGGGRTARPEDDQNKK